MRLIYENDTTLFNTKETQTRRKKDKFKNIFFRILFRKWKQPLAIYRYQLLSSVVYL